MAKKAIVARAQRFKGTLEKGSYGLGWTTVRVPFEPRKVWPEMIRHRVQGEVDGVSFRTSLFAVPGGDAYLLLVTNAVQKAAGIAVGSVAEFVLEPDMEPRPAELPEELAMLLEEEPGLRAWYEEFSESMRREMGKWVVGVKSEVSRVKRAEQMAERLLAAMEGERELPPVLVAAFKRRPKAKVGWSRMTVLQRRQELLAIFYYQTPEARLKRVEKVCDTAEKKA